MKSQTIYKAAKVELQYQEVEIVLIRSIKDAISQELQYSDKNNCIMSYLTPKKNTVTRSLLVIIATYKKLQ